MKTSAWCVSGLIVVACQGCSPPVFDSSPREPVAESDVAGSWQLNYEGTLVPSGWISGKETLILEADGKYQQLFEDGKGDYPTISSIWKLSKNYDGQQVISLNRMRYFPDGVTRATSETPRERVQLLIQEISKLPFGIGEKELILCFEDADLNRCFGRGSRSDKK